MRKNEASLNQGDWVLTDSMISDRYVSSPWQVESVVRTRVYLRRWRFDRSTQFNEIVEQKYIASKRVMYAFSTPQEAQRMSDMARTLAEQLDTQIRNLRKANQTAFEGYVAGVPIGASLKPQCVHEYDPLTKNKVYQCCLKCGLVDYVDTTASPWHGLAAD